MRPLIGDVRTGFMPRDFAGHDPSRVPNPVLARTDHKYHPVPNPTNPGYAYGTVIPSTSKGCGGLARFKNPWTYPEVSSFSRQHPMTAQVQGVTADASRALRPLGSTNYIPGPDYGSLNAIQAKLSAARR